MSGNAAHPPRHQHRCLQPTICGCSWIDPAATCVKTAACYGLPSRTFANPRPHRAGIGFAKVRWARTTKTLNRPGGVIG